MATSADSPLSRPEQIQGNILRPFGGRHQAFLVLSFSNDQAGARRWLAGVAGRVTGTAGVPARVPEDKSRFAPGQTLLNVGLTAAGLVVLHPETAGHLSAYEAFWSGPLGPRTDAEGRVTTTAALLGDIGRSDPESWKFGGLGPPVDAVVTIAAGRDREAFDQAVRREQAAAADAGLKLLHTQLCEVHRRNGQRVEHFGYADGISQPAVRGFTDDESPRAGSPAIAAGEFVVGCDAERRPPSWKQRPVPARWMRGGSFQVVRRLEQDAVGWWKRMEELREENESAEDVAARVMGRRLDGTPLANPKATRENRNDFTFDDDPDGARTPLYAHIRKVNPRDDMVFRNRIHKMLRRGVPFGDLFDRKNLADDGEKRGIIFNSYLTSIEDQFEHVQSQWATNVRFPSNALAKYGRIAADPPRVDGLDPVLGEARTAEAERLGEDAQHVPEPAYGGFVTTTGAVYAFAPSLPALWQLAGDERIDG